jgi:hypothetical protein
MSLPPPDADESCLSAAEINAQIRVLTAGRSTWSRAELRELARLQAAWRQASAREAALAA